MMPECNVMVSQGARVSEEPIGTPQPTGRSPERPASNSEREIAQALNQNRDTRWVIVMDPATHSAIVCQNVVSYDGVAIYRMIPGRIFQNHEDAVVEVLRLRKNDKANKT
jgi:hypothetical protein